MIWENHAYLMSDPTLIAHEENTSMVLEEAGRRPASPIIGERDRKFFLGRPGYRIWVRCVAREGGRYRMWYEFQAMGDGLAGADRLPHFLGYAESEDGFAWSPVNVGTVKHGGSNRNNLWRVSDDPDIGLSGMMHDPSDPDWPYKAVVLRTGDTGALNPAVRAKWPDVWARIGHHAARGRFIWGIARSRDGFEWTLPSHAHNMIDEIPEGPAIFRALDGGYVIGNQMVSPTSRYDGRRVKGWVTYDLETAHRIPEYVFSLPEHMTRVQSRDLGSTWHNSHWVQSHVGLVPARKGPTLLALTGHLYGNWAAETYAQKADIGLAASTTGYQFDPVWPFMPFFRRGAVGEWDAGMVVQKALIDTPKQTVIYYLGCDQGNAGGCPYRVGTAVIGRDRYGFRGLKVMRDYRAPKARYGLIALKPCRLPDRPALSVNVTHVTSTRTVRIELRDPETGRPIPGFTFRTCSAVTQAGLRRPVVWDSRNLATLSGRIVQIAIELVSPDCQFGEQDSPRLYALYTGRSPR